MGQGSLRGDHVHTRGCRRLQEKGLELARDRRVELASIRRRRAIQRGRAYRDQHADILGASE